MENQGKLISLELDDEDKIDGMIGPSVPDHPYGMRLSFDKATLEKTGLAAELSAGRIEHGDTLHIRALGRVTHISQGDEGHRMEVQLTHIFAPVEDEDKE